MPPEQAGPFDPLDTGRRNERLHTFSHALKNRMGGLWQAAAMLHDMPEGPERPQLLAMAEKSYFAAARELEQLMDDFAVPRGIGTLRIAPVDLPALIERAVGGIAFRTVKKGQTVHLHRAALPPVAGDDHVLLQLFEALIGNASKFSPQGARIDVGMQADGRHALIEVTDQGVGLTAEDLRDVFTRYAMLSSRSTGGESQARSTLARAKQWATAHGGTLTASSQGPGTGSTFRVTLPLAPGNGD